MSNKRHQFQPGNKSAVGHDGTKSRRQMLTQEIISMLHEIDEVTGQEKKRRLIDALYKNAVGYEYEQKHVTAAGKTVKHKVQVPSDNAAIKELIDRVQGKAPQAVEIGGPEGRPTIQLIEYVIVDPDGTRSEPSRGPVIIEHQPKSN